MSSLANNKLRNGELLGPTGELVLATKQLAR